MCSGAQKQSLPLSGSQGQYLISSREREDYQNIVLVSIYIVLWDAEKYIFVRADFPPFYTSFV